MKYLLCCLMVSYLTTSLAQSIDSTAMKQVDSLIQVSRALTGKSEFDQALKVNALAEKITLEKLGRESAAYGSCAFNRGRINYFKRNYSEAEIWYLESKTIREKMLGKEHPDYAWILHNLALLYSEMSKYEKAEPLALEAKAIREKVLGKEHPHYVGSLNHLAIIYQNLGNYQKAESLYLEAKAIDEKVLGKEHPDYATSLQNLAILYWYMGNYEKAEPLYLEAKAIYEKVLGKEHFDSAPNLNNLAALYQNMGNYEKAEPLFLEAKAIFEKSVDKEHPDYAASMNNLAVIYTLMGNYQKAEPIYLETLSIREKVLGKEHPLYAGSLNNLAAIYNYMGNNEKAEPLYFEAKDIWGKVLGKEHPDYAASLNNLTILYMDMGNYEKAEPLNLEAIAIREKVLGKEHPDYAGSLQLLAILYYKMGNYEKAEPLYLEAKAIREKVLGNEHPDYARSLHNLAVLHQDLGNYEKAEPLYLEAKAIYEKVLGKEHPDYANNLDKLANMYEKQTRFLEAESLIEEARTHSQSRVVNATSFLSEQELAKYAVTFQNSGDNLSTYIHARLAVEAESGILPNLAYDHALFYKGFLLTAAARLNAPATASPETVEINIRLKGYRRRLAAEYTKPIDERKGIAELEEKANIAEKELARSVAGYADALRQVKWDEVKANLKQTEAAIEFVHFKVNFPKKTDSTMYAALLLLPGATQPLFIRLFEEKEFGHLLSADRERKADYVNDLYAWADRGMIKLGSEKKSLYELIWAKIQGQIPEGITTIYYSPSGVLHRLNLGAIAVDEETILSDRYNMVALNSTRQLVIPAIVNAPAKNALLVGGVNFEADTLQSGFDETSLISSRSSVGIWSESGTRGGSWSYLKWTEKEVERIASTLTTGGFRAAQFTRSGATEEVIKAIGKDASSPRVLHIATHGFFFPDPELAPSTKRVLGEAEPVFKASDNPMIRSGLILAGGNYAWQHGRAVRPDKEDGILTAYEISQMNLSNTELVVLSACETGLGDIQGNEGVYGLQRAFKIAGAKYLIMSLWQVPDRETMEFMTTFYKNWLPSDAEALAGKEEKLTIPDAFRKTQREMRDRFFNPYSWAAFVLVE